MSLARGPPSRTATEYRQQMMADARSDWRRSCYSDPCATIIRKLRALALAGIGPALPQRLRLMLNGIARAVIQPLQIS